MNQRVREPQSVRTWGKGIALVALPVLAALLAGVFAPLSPAAAPPTIKRRTQKQEPPPPPPEGAARFPFEERAKLGAATLLLNGQASVPGTSALGMAWQQLMTLRAGELQHCWTIIDTDVFRPFPDAWLPTIEDGRGFPVGSLDVGTYEKALVLANLTSLKAFAGAADKSLSYGHLFNAPATYRGKVVRAEGRLRRINRYDPPAGTIAEGVHDLYEAWIINDDYGGNPYYVVFSNWPVGLSRDLLGQSTIKQKILVQFDGYFYKKYPYKTLDSKEKTHREAPLLVGNSLKIIQVLTPPPPKAEPWVGKLIYVFMGILGIVVLIITGLTIWFRRSDKTIRRRLLATRATELVLPPPDAMPVAPPADSPAHRFATTAPNNSRSTTAATSAATRWGDRTGERGASTSAGDSKPSEGGQGSMGGLGRGPEPGEDAGA